MDQHNTTLRSMSREYTRTTL